MAPAGVQTGIVPRAASLSTRTMVLAALLTVLAVCARSQDSQKTGDESWTKSKETNLANFNPSRTTNSHTKAGNRTVDKERVDVLGPNGGYQPSSETETETVQIDANTTRTVVRTYRFDDNGQRSLAQVSEEESKTTAAGNARVERKTSNADVNGHLQVARREVMDTRKISPDVEETKSTVYRADSYGGFTQTEQTEELKTHNRDDSVVSKKTTFTPDGNGRWKVNDVTEKTVKADGKDRTSEEQVSRADLNGRLQESARTVTREKEAANGETKTTVETYTVNAPEYTDGRMHMSQRVTTTRKKDSGGEVTEENVEQPSAGNPGDGPKVVGRGKYVVKYARPGSEQSKTVETRDANGKFHAASVETQKSNQPPPEPKAPAPDKP